MILQLEKRERLVFYDMFDVITHKILDITNRTP